MTFQHVEFMITKIWKMNNLDEELFLKLITGDQIKKYLDHPKFLDWLNRFRVIYNSYDDYPTKAVIVEKITSIQDNIRQINKTISRLPNGIQNQIAVFDLLPDEAIELIASNAPEETEGFIDYWVDYKCGGLIEGLNRLSNRLSTLIPDGTLSKKTIFVYEIADLNSELFGEISTKLVDEVAAIFLQEPSYDWISNYRKFKKSKRTAIHTGKIR